MSSETLPVPRKTRVADIKNRDNIEFADAEEISDQESLNLTDVERQMIEQALDKYKGNRKNAAKELGISDRTLYRKIKQYGMDKK